MRIGLVTWYGTGNFGTDLQAYAFLHYMEKQGHEVKLIPDFKYKELGPKYTIRRFLGKIKRQVLLYLKGSTKQKVRYKISNSYIKNILSVYQLVTTNRDYENMIDYFDCFITGSDQIWNPYYLNSFNFLDFNVSKPCFAYASSVGVDEIPEDKNDFYKKHLSKFRAIGVREISGVKAIEKATGIKNIKVVLDPTFMLTSDDWKEFSDKDKKFILPCSDYMLVYTIGSRSIYPTYINRIKDHYGIENVVVVSSIESQVNYSADYVLDDVTPMAFIKLVSEAKLICTDSFHATAISINMNKNFIEFLRFDDNNKDSQNSRIKDVLNHYGLNERLYCGNMSQIQDINIDYTNINDILNKDRDFSSNFINKAITLISK